MEKAAHPANPATDRNAETKKTSTAQRNVGEISNLALDARRSPTTPPLRQTLQSEVTNLAYVGPLAALDPPRRT